VNNVVFSCGAVVIQDTLYFYYGGGDRVIGVATIGMNELLDKLRP
jgi:beta-1,2-mannobiose phosphorylase / 1,2-beta-oligomannan phosphorylase